MAEKIGTRFLVAGCTDVGCVRTLNEDHFRVDPKNALLLVADGMGGHDAGEVASAKVIDSICHTLQGFLKGAPDQPEPKEEEEDDGDITLANFPADGGDEPTLDDMPNPIVGTVQNAVNKANTELNDINRQKGYPDGMGMGTTLVGLWLPEFSEHPVVFHVGDSRLYLCRQGRLIQVTKDHSMYQQWLNFGAKGEPPAKNILLQAMGPARHVTPDVRFQSISKGDLFLLCSDGLTGMVADEKIQKLLSTVSKKNLDKVCERLVEMAKDGGGKDNVTVILGYVMK